MFRKKLYLIFIGLVFALSLISLYFINKFDLFFKKPAGLIVNTNIPSQIILDNKTLGTTPYTNDRLHPGEYTLILKPTSQKQLSDWQTKIHLYRGVSTAVHYNFAFNTASSSGYIVQYEPNADSNQATISVISDPDICSLTIDQQPHGFTPLKKTQISAGKHQLQLTSPGYQPLNLQVTALSGYNLLVQVKLAQNLLTLEPELSASASASASASTTQPTESNPESTISALTKPYVIIKPTGTGWLRVREEPSTAAKEVGKVDVGQKLKFIEANETGWYKVLFQGKEAWISGRYADLYR